jgi:hypothetical protein
MHDLTISDGFIQDVARAIGAAGKAMHLPAAATSSGVEGLESSEAIAALESSNRGRVERARLSAAAFEQLSISTMDVGIKVSEADRALARSVETP